MFLNLVEFGMTVQQACEAANINTNQLWLSLGGTQLKDRQPKPGNILLDRNTPLATQQVLKKMGYSVSLGNRTSGPINASNPAGGMVLANLLASPEGQLQKFDPSVWGDPPLLTRSRLSPEMQQKFDQVEAAYGIPLQALAKDTVPVVNSDYTTRLEQGWEAEIAR